MPTPTLQNPQASQQTGSAGKSATALPFPQGSSELTQQFGSTQVIPANEWAGITPIGPLDILALGYLRGVWVEVSATGGAAGGSPAVFAPDAPFTVFQQGILSDSVNAPWVGPTTGYDMYLLTKYGGYAQHDPKLDWDYVIGDQDGNFAFRIYLPAEIIARTALASLPNQNSAATNKIQLYVNPPSSVYTTAPGTLPSVSVTLILDAWNSVPLHDVAGNQLTQMPPGGKIRQYWTETTFNNVPTGQYELQLQRKGYYFRNLIFVTRDNTGARQNGIFPDPCQFTIDGNTRTFIYPDLLQKQMQDKFELTGDFDSPGGLDSGVYVLDGTSDLNGNAWRGNELRTQWLASLKASNYWFQGNWAANGGSVIVVTNDVAPDPADSVWLPAALLL